LIACGPRLSEMLREQMPDLYAYLGGECGWAPSELDRWSIDELTNWANARSRANDRSS